MKGVLELLQFICSILLNIGCLVLFIGMLAIDESLSLFFPIVFLAMFIGSAYMVKIAFMEYKSEINN